jgi:hypothetical protein
MAALLTQQYLFWAFTTLLEVCLFVLLIQQKLYVSHPAFTVYILIAILQSAFVATVYVYFGSSSRQSYFIAWGSQGVVVCARWLAVMEIAKNALGTYRGIWALAKRMLLVLSIVVLAYSIYISKSRWTLVILTADRALELCIAAFIVGMFFFVRYYRVPMLDLDRVLAIGFCLFSCFHVINDSMYEQWRKAIGTLWHYLDTLTFVATLLLWIGATWKHSEVPQTTAQPKLTPEQGSALSGELTSRLDKLNNRLDELFRSKNLR